MKLYKVAASGPDFPVNAFHHIPVGLLLEDDPTQVRATSMPYEEDRYMVYSSHNNETITNLTLERANQIHDELLSKHRHCNVYISKMVLRTEVY